MKRLFLLLAVSSLSMGASAALTNNALTNNALTNNALTNNALTNNALTLAPVEDKPLGIDPIAELAGHPLAK